MRPEERNTPRVDQDSSTSVVRRISALLAAFGPQETSIGVNELARRTAIPKATVSRLVKDLESGFPSREHLLNRYCDWTGADATRINWHIALAQFKLAALYEYGRRRAAGGGDTYFADSGMVWSFLSCGEAQMD
jgi:aminoglycoside phosphotransferase (APT) family kinase protein